jgi:tetratricopeptide (TPR) repeat protein
MNRRLGHGLAAAAIVLLACALYLPFRGNPMVFDDMPFFSGSGFAHAASTPLGLGKRTLPRFTLAAPQVLWGKYPPWDHAHLHRLISLAFHAACALALYALLFKLVIAVRRVRSASVPDAEAIRNDARWLAFAGAAAFAIHPVAVYGAGYLMQRTVVMATLFGLLSFIAFLRGLDRERYSDALVAGVFYALSIFSKEHALLLPAAVVLAAPLAGSDRRFAVRYSGIYLLACAPAALIMFMLVRGVVGEAYEPYVHFVLEQIEGIPALDMQKGPWLVSAVTQAGLFFEYLRLWLVPDTARMSIDLRPDIAGTWTPAWIALKVSAFGAFGALGCYLVARRGRAGLFGLGMLYAWALFAVELSSVRFQEPFVLYRSYLWAPGFMMMLVAVLGAVGMRKRVPVFLVAALPVLFYQAHDRLRSFSSNLALWEDAVAKLPEHPVPGGSRVLFGMARELVYVGRPSDAARIADRCMVQYPKTWHCNFSRGAVHVQFGEYEQALALFDRAAAIAPEQGTIHMQRGIALEKLSRIDEARSAYTRAAELGFVGGDYRLDLLDNPGTGRGRMIFDAARVKRKAE